MKKPPSEITLSPRYTTGFLQGRTYFGLDYRKRLFPLSLAREVSSLLLGDPPLLLDETPFSRPWGILSAFLKRASFFEKSFSSPRIESMAPLEPLEPFQC